MEGKRTSEINHSETDDEGFLSECEAMLATPEIYPSGYLESAYTSQKAWTKSLKNGCLGKGIMNKARLFSRVRQLVNQTDIPLTPILSSQPHGTQQEEKENEWETKCGISIPASLILGGGRNSRLTSVLIIEDTSIPPQQSEKAVPRYCTDDDLFTFLSSNEWGGSSMIRVVGGNILPRILTALYMLQAKRMICTKGARAYLNNGYWKIPQEGKQQEEDAQKFVEHEEITEQQQEPSQKSIEKEWVSEKILVDMTFYSKLDETSETTMEPLINNCKAQTPFSIQPEIAKLSVTTPAAYRLHPAENMKFPPGEHVDYSSKIKRLHCEMEAEREKAKVKEEEVKHKLEPESAKGKGGVQVEQYTTSADVEDITEDLCFGCVRIEEKKEEQVKEKEENDEMQEEGEANERDGENEEEEGEDKDNVSDDEEKKNHEENSDVKSGAQILQEKNEAAASVVLNPPVVIATESQHEADRFDVESVESGESRSNSGSIQHTHSATSSYTSSRTEDSRKSLAPVEMRRLNLTGNELYATALYKEKEVNAKPFALRIHQTNQKRLKQRRETEVNAYNKLCEDRNVDLDTRFKRLAVAKDRRKLKTMDPVIPTSRGVKPQTISEDPWVQYYKDMEEMEMRVATDTNIERQMLKRLREGKNQPVTATHAADSKKNKAAKNNNNSSEGDMTNNASKLKTTQKNERVKHGTGAVLKTKRGKLQKSTPNPKQVLYTKEVGRGVMLSQDYGVDSVDSSCPIQKFQVKSVRFSPILTTVYNIEDNNPALHQDTDPLNLMKDGNKRESNVPRLPPLVKSWDRSKSHLSIRPVTSQDASKRIFLFQNPGLKQDRMLRRKSVNDQSHINRSMTGARGSGINRQSHDRTGSNSAHNESEHSGSKTKESALALEIPEGEDAEHLDDPEHDEAEDNQSPSTVRTPTPVGPTESEILRSDLARLDRACLCDECTADDLDYLRPDCRGPPFSYPYKLGQLKRSYRYLQNVPSEIRISDRFEISSWYSPGLNDASLREELLCLMDKMTIRKDVISSSLGKTFTTILFIK